MKWIVVGLSLVLAQPCAADFRIAAPTVPADVTRMIETRRFDSAIKRLEPMLRKCVREQLKSSYAPSCKLLAFPLARSYIEVGRYEQAAAVADGILRQAVSIPSLIVWCQAMLALKRDDACAKRLAPEVRLYSRAYAPSQDDRIAFFLNIDIASRERQPEQARLKLAQAIADISAHIDTWGVQRRTGPGTKTLFGKNVELRYPSDLDVPDIYAGNASIFRRFVQLSWRVSRKPE